ncbi:hypothetical protein [Clostridium novyi]
MEKNMRLAVKEYIKERLVNKKKYDYIQFNNVSTVIKLDNVYCSKFDKTYDFLLECTKDMQDYADFKYDKVYYRKANTNNKFYKIDVKEFPHMMMGIEDEMYLGVGECVCK